MPSIPFRLSRSWLAPVILAGTLAVGIGAAGAQDAPPVAVRGTITTVGADILKIKTNRGTDIDVKLDGATGVRGVALANIAEIQPGRYIGTAAVPQPDGTLKALEVHIFPPEMAGTGDGHRPWDLTPNSSMTNGAVGDLVVANGRTITVKYKQGEKKVVVPDDVPIVDLEPGDRSLLAAGTHVVLFARKDGDGALTALFISAGRNGVTPPM
ncbi:hypothetical protein [Telmatospirillum siberiense]|uniref:DUF5666 domain-containing protein n=1 Tax=Telmatospirillum siberiense TaxID=382514 RepID=A0A2N3PZ31_9PROT|nr:hypothetical protein [Telmatospirillum siberiense]PKU25660.1 hypothetical protein CWS72_06280 [Telmatospirillum siberiense]